MISRKLGVLLAVLAIAMSSLAMLAPSASADSAPQVTINDVTALRPSSGTANFTFTITLEYPSLNPVNVNYYTSDGSARSTFDYQYTAGVVTFAPGQVTKTVSVKVNGTTLHTGDRYFYLNINNPINAVVVHSYGVGFIQDNTSNPYVNISDATVVQGDGVANTAAFTVSLTSASANPVRVKYATADGSARAGFEYTPVSGTVTIPAASTTATVNVPVLATSTYATSRYFNVNISNPVNATMSRNSATGTILNDNHTAYVTVDDATIKNPGSGTATLNFPVRLESAATFDVTLNYATSDGSATVAGGDYAAKVGTLTIPAGSTQVLVPVTVNGTAASVNKNLSLSISNNSPGSSIQRGSANGIIVGSSAYSQFALGDASIVAPKSGTATLHLTISLTPPSASATSVHWATSDGSAVNGTNYTAASGTASFAAGVTSQTIAVPILTSNTTFVDTYFNVSLATPTGGAVIERGQGYGTILAANVAPNLTITPVAVAQPTSGTTTATWTVTLTPASPNTVTAHFATSDGSAVAPADYVATNGTVTFAPGATSKTISVTVNSNTSYFGANKYFYVTLSSPVSAVLQNNQAFTYLVNPNKAPTLSVNNIAVYKPLTGKAPATFTVSLSSASVNTVTVNYATSDGSAVAVQRLHRRERDTHVRARHPQGHRGGQRARHHRPHGESLLLPLDLGADERHPAEQHRAGEHHRGHDRPVPLRQQPDRRPAHQRHRDGHLQRDPDLAERQHGHGALRDVGQLRGRGSRLQRGGRHRHLRSGGDQPTRERDGPGPDGQDR